MLSDVIGIINFKSFSAKLTFDLHGQHYEFESDTRYKNKKDARQNVSYQACSRLGLARYNCKYNIGWRLNLDLSEVLW